MHPVLFFMKRVSAAIIVFSSVRVGCNSLPQGHDGLTSFLLAILIPVCLGINDGSKVWFTILGIFTKFLSSSWDMSQVIKTDNSYQYFIIQCVSRMRKRPFKGTLGATFHRHYRALRR
jgi:hypothetical protein